MRAVRSGDFNGRQPILRLWNESPSGGWGAYARDKNTSVRVRAKNAGGLMCEGGIFVVHYGVEAQLSAATPCGVIFASNFRTQRDLHLDKQNLTHPTKDWLYR